MDSKDIKNLFEAYTAVYDEDLRDEIEYASVDEDLSFVDDLSDNELTQIMEEIFDETEITLDECVNSLGFYLSEARTSSGVKITRGGAGAREKRAQTSTARVTAGAGSGGGFDRARRAEKTSERQQKVRIGRLAQAAQTAAEYPGKQARRAATAVAGGARAAAARANTLAGGAASAAAGGAAEAGRKIQSAKEKVKGFLGKVGRVAGAAKEAARKEFSGEAGRQAKLRSSFRSNVKSARQNARAAAAKDTSEFERPKAPQGPYRGQGRGGREQAGGRQSSSGATPSTRMQSQQAKERIIKMAKRVESERSAPTGGAGSPLPPVGVASRTPGGERRRQSQTDFALQRAAAAGKKKLSKEEFDYILENILENLIQEGYAYDINGAFEILETISESDFNDILDAYLIEETEVVDLYDVVLSHLLDEGYAETIEDAEVIMVNMSEDWRDEILSDVDV